MGTSARGTSFRIAPASVGCIPYLVKKMARSRNKKRTYFLDDLALYRKGYSGYRESSNAGNFIFLREPIFLLKPAESGTNRIKYSGFISHEDVSKDQGIHDIFFEWSNTGSPWGYGC